MHAVVVGTGFGGLGAAVRLAARGYDVTMLERRDKAGGRGYVWEQDGFKFDAGPTIITAPFLFDELFELVGRNIKDYVEVFPVDPYYNVRFHDGSIFTYSGNPEKMKEQVQKFAPEDVAGYEKFMELSAIICKKGFIELAHVPFNDVWSMVKVIPDLMKLQSYRSVLGLVKKYIKSEKLRQVFSFHPLLLGGDPQHAPAIYAMICHLEREWGVHFAKGGMGAMVQALCKLITDVGGKIRFNAEVEQILVENARTTGVRLKGGEVVKADLVVCNSDVSWTYQHLIEKQHRPRNSDAKYKRMRYSMSAFLVYFGTKKKYPELLQHTIMMGPRYEGLLTDIFSNKVLSKDFSLYLHAPSRGDPSLAPPGHEAFYALVPVPNLQAKGLDWAKEKTRFRDSVYDYLENSLVPGLRENLVSERLFTPADFETDLLSHVGAAFSFEPRLTQSAWFRPHNQSEDIENLFFVGAGTHPGAGLPGVLSSAKAVMNFIPEVKRDVAAKAAPRAEEGRAGAAL
jgi:phytoene desaturase